MYTSERKITELRLFIALLAETMQRIGAVPNWAIRALTDEAQYAADDYYAMLSRDGVTDGEAMTAIVTAYKVAKA